MSAREEIEALGFKVPDAVEPIVACRSWQYHRAKLLSHNHTPWTPGEALKARCCLYLAHDHLIPPIPDEESPVKRCTCGIYAAKAEDARGIIPCAAHYVLGEVYLWGKILEGPRGYRAEYAYPKQFFVASEDLRHKVEALGFGVPVTVVEGIGGVGPNRFPFPAANTGEKVRRSLVQSLPLLSGVPALVVGIVDLLTLDMSRAFNQVLVAVVSSVGLLAAAMSIQLIRLRRRINNQISVANSGLQLLVAIQEKMKEMDKK